MNERFIGRWLLVSEAEVRTAEFTADGAMTYVITFEGRELELQLRYRVEGRTIVTSPDEVVASFDFVDDDTLILDYSGQRFTFRRVLPSRA
ncbi:MAG: hypothetical protein QOI24_3980 [Acidobacteriota bacterium]|jgi:hypothetical protein|nr:hypothetical protein [Acidobacteriota bacterium]